MTARLSLAFRVFAILAISALLLGARPATFGDGLPELFGPGPGGALDPAQAGPQALRARSASLNSALLDTVRASLDAGLPASAVALPLFDGVRPVVHFERVETFKDGSYALAGRVDNSRFGEVHLAVSPNSFFASLNTPDGLFRASSLDGQNAQIVQLDPGAFPPEGEAVPPSLPFAGPLRPTVKAPEVGSTTVDDGSRIDVYVGYDTAAKNAAAGAGYNIVDMINTAIAETNTGYSNSLISQRVYLVGSDEYVYDETGFNWNTALNDWTGTADGHMDVAHTARDTLKADEMVFLVSNTAYCGLGWLMTSGSISPAFAYHGFVIVAWNCLTGYYSFAHEMGHNEGAHHDRVTAAGAQGAYPYAYGFWIANPANAGKFDWRTVMAYNVPAGYGYNSTRVNYWSNPNVLYSGQPTGKPVADAASAYNAQVLNNTAPSVAQFRDGAAPGAPVSLAPTTINGTTTRLNWGAATGTWIYGKYRIERSANYGSTWAEIGTTAYNTLTYTDSTQNVSTNYAYRVLTDNGNGRTVSSAIYASPLAPLAAATSRGSRVIGLSWPDSANEINYQVYRCNNNTTCNAPTLLSTLAQNNTKFLVTGLLPDTMYYLQVWAHNSNGDFKSAILQVRTMPRSFFMPGIKNY